MSDNSKHTYSQILKATSIIGSTQVINMFLGLLRVKFSAVLIGPVGVGLVANYGVIQNAVGTIAGLGIQTSGVRSIAAAIGKNDQETIGRVATTLRKVCWLTGLLGALAMVLLSPILSHWSFGSPDYTLEVALLGGVILFNNITGGRTAMIQGARNLVDLAKLNVSSAVIGTVLTIMCYAAFGLDGILPALLLMGSFKLLASMYFARTLEFKKVKMKFHEYIDETKQLTSLGSVMMSVTLLRALVSYLTFAWIAHLAGLEAVGIYSAAFTLASMFTKFIIEAMWTDYYPRLASISEQHSELNRQINEQSEVSLLLALPGLLATLCFAPWVIRIFYTSEFLQSADLLQWFVLGLLGLLISYPLDCAILAMGKARIYLFIMLSISSLQLALNYYFLSIYGVEGVAIAFFCVNYFGAILMFFVCKKLTKFSLYHEPFKLLYLSHFILFSSFIVNQYLNIWASTLYGFFLIFICFVYCTRGLVKRIGTGHRLIRWVCRMPLGKKLCGISSPPNG